MGRSLIRRAPRTSPPSDWTAPAPGAALLVDLPPPPVTDGGGRRSSTFPGPVVGGSPKRSAPPKSASPYASQHAEQVVRRPDLRTGSPVDAPRRQRLAGCLASWGRLGGGSRCPWRDAGDRSGPGWRRRCRPRRSTRSWGTRSGGAVAGDRTRTRSGSSQPSTSGCDPHVHDRPGGPSSTVDSNAWATARLSS